MAKLFFLSMALGCFLVVWAVPSQAADSSKGNATAVITKVAKFKKETNYDAFASKFVKAVEELIKINHWKEDETLLEKHQVYYDANDNGRRDDDYATLLKEMNLDSLTLLCLSYAGKFDGETIKGADKLKELRLFGAPLDDLSFLTGKSLEVLQLSLAKGVDLSPLAKLPLKELVISGEGAANLDFVKNFPQLSAFCVHHAPVRDLSPLAGLPLKELALEALPDLTDIAPVAALPQLRLFSLRGTNVSDVGVLAKAAIVDLALCDNPKIATLPFIPSVKVLRLFKTKIKDASAWDGKKIAIVYHDETFPSEKIVDARYDDEEELSNVAAKLSDTNPLDLRKRSGLSLSEEE